MSWEHVLRRDLTCVYRTRTGTGVAALIGLCTAGAAALLALTNTGLELVALLGTVLLAGSVVTIVFFGTPRMVAGAITVFACFALAVASLFPHRYAEPPTQEMAVVSIGSVLSFVIPLVAMLATYASLVGETETGSVRFLFGLPNSRTDAYLGKFLSRSVVVVVPLVAGLVAAALVAALTFREGASFGLLGLAVVSVPYALLFVGVGVSASGFADTDNQAVALIVAAFVLSRAAWPALQWLGLQGMEDPYPRPEWYFWIGRSNPMNAYTKLTTLFVEESTYHPLLTVPSTYDGTTAAAASLATSHGFAAAVLLFWMVVAPLFGFGYYRHRDLL